MVGRWCNFQFQSNDTPTDLNVYTIIIKVFVVQWTCITYSLLIICLFLRDSLPLRGDRTNLSIDRSYWTITGIDDHDYFQTLVNQGSKFESLCERILLCIWTTQVRGRVRARVYVCEREREIVKSWFNPVVCYH